VVREKNTTPSEVFCEDEDEEVKIKETQEDYRKDSQSMTTTKPFVVETMSPLVL